MSKPAYLIDGFSEKLILDKLCPGHPIRRIDMNGKDVSIEALGKTIGSLIRLLNNRNYPIIIIIDREQRTETRQEILKGLLDALEKQGISIDQIRIGIADRMLENWILADWENFRNEIGQPTLKKPCATFEGLNGKSMIRKYLKEYQETTDAVRLMVSSNPDRIRENSSSFNDLISSMTDLDCSWIPKKN